jgi:hypothetical protein
LHFNLLLLLLLFICIGGNFSLRLLNSLLFSWRRIFFRFTSFRLLVFSSITITVRYDYILFIVNITSRAIFFFFFLRRRRNSTGWIVDVEVDVFIWQRIHAR